MADPRILPAWLAQNPLGRYLRAQENLFFQAALTDRQPENLLLLGSLGRLFALPPLSGLTVHQDAQPPADVLAGSLKTRGRMFFSTACWPPIRLGRRIRLPFS